MSPFAIFMAGVTIGAGVGVLVIALIVYVAIRPPKVGAAVVACPNCEGLGCHGCDWWGCDRINPSTDEAIRRHIARRQLQDVDLPPHARRP